MSKIQSLLYDTLEAMTPEEREAWEQRQERNESQEQTNDQ